MCSTNWNTYGNRAQVRFSCIVMIKMILIYMHTNWLTTMNPPICSSVSLSMRLVLMHLCVVAGSVRLSVHPVVCPSSCLLIHLFICVALSRTATSYSVLFYTNILMLWPGPSNRLIKYQSVHQCSLLNSCNRHIKTFLLAWMHFMIFEADTDVHLESHLFSARTRMIKLLPAQTNGWDKRRKE